MGIGRGDVTGLVARRARAGVGALSTAHERGVWRPGRESSVQVGPGRGRSRACCCLVSCSCLVCQLQIASWWNSFTPKLCIEMRIMSGLASRRSPARRYEPLAKQPMSSSLVAASMPLGNKALTKATSMGVVGDARRATARARLFAGSGRAATLVDPDSAAERGVRKTGLSLSASTHTRTSRKRINGRHKGNCGSRKDGDRVGGRCG